MMNNLYQGTVIQIGEFVLDKPLTLGESDLLFDKLEPHFKKSYIKNGSIQEYCYLLPNSSELTKVVVQLNNTPQSSPKDCIENILQLNATTIFNLNTLEFVTEIDPFKPMI